MSTTAAPVYDVAIIGLGPAGATLARMLDPRLRVVAIDKKDLTGGDGFRKPCGGLLARDAQKSLSRFNLTLPKDLLVDPQIFAVRTTDTRQQLTRYYQRFYMNMDRHKFDLWLAGLVGSHVDVIDRSACVGIDRDGDTHTVRFARDGKPQTVRARYVVGADGANSVVRRKMFPDKKIRTYISIQEWFLDRNPRPLYSCFFDSEITDCYAWSISKDGYFIVGGAFPRTGGRQKFELLKDKLAARGYVFGDVVHKEACQVLRPSGLLDHCFGGDGVFLIGEAGGLISPSSLEGISYALDSAEMLAGVLNSRRPDPNRSYSRKVLGIRAKLLAKNLKSIFMYVPFIRGLVMRSGLSAIAVPDAALPQSAAPRSVVPDALP